MSPKKPGRRRYNQGHQAGPGTVVTLAYALFDAEGEKVEESEPSAPLEVLIGFGETSPALEEGLSGLSAGDRREIVLAPEDAYGERDHEAVIEVDRHDLPRDLSPGDELAADREDGGGVVLLKVLELQDDVAVLDTNHPLSGQNVRLAVEVLAVRPATDEEMEAAVARLTSPRAEVAPLLPAERLLRRKA